MIGTSFRVAVVAGTLALSLAVSQAAYAVAPDTTIDSGPPDDSLVMPGTVMTYTFSGVPSADSFECSIDDGPYATCTSPQSYNLGFYTHIFRVRAILGGQPDLTPAIRYWYVRNVPCEQAGADYRVAQGQYFKYQTKKGYTKEKLQRAKYAHNQHLIKKYTRKIKRLNKKIRYWRNAMDAASAKEDAVC